MHLPALLLFLFTFHALAADKIFRAGAAASNVTPWLGVSMPGAVSYTHLTLPTKA